MWLLSACLLQALGAEPRTNIWGDLVAVEDTAAFGSKQGQAHLFDEAVPMQASRTAINEHAVLERASAVWLKDGPLNWGHYSGAHCPNFLFW
jgi:hypothetical protein